MCDAGYTHWLHDFQMLLLIKALKLNEYTENYWLQQQQYRYKLPSSIDFRHCRIWHPPRCSPGVLILQCCMLHVSFTYLSVAKTSSISNWILGIVIELQFIVNCYFEIKFTNCYSGSSNLLIISSYSVLGIRSFSCIFLRYICEVDHEQES